MIFLSRKEMIGGSLASCIRFLFFIQASFLVDTESWYCVANGNISDHIKSKENSEIYSFKIHCCHTICTFLSAFIN